jgi:hypothetical protein
MSKTPRTDAELQGYYEDDVWFGEESTLDMANFARQLETELTDLKAQRLRELDELYTIANQHWEDHSYVFPKDSLNELRTRLAAMREGSE